MTKELIQQLIELEANATGGEWGISGSDGYTFDLEISARDGEKVISAGYEGDGGVVEMKNADLIVSLRNNAKALLDEIERLQDEVEKLKKSSLEIEKPDGSKGYIQVHCAFPHDNDVNLGWRANIVMTDTSVQFDKEKWLTKEQENELRRLCNDKEI